MMHDHAKRSPGEDYERYQTILERIDSGFCVIQAERGAVRPVYRILEANSALERLLGLGCLEGRDAQELGSAIDLWVDSCRRVIDTGRSSRVVAEATTIDRWLDVHAFGLAKDCVAIVTTDVTDQKLAQAARRQSEARQTFLLRLSDALRPLGAPLEIERVAARLLGEQLGADWAYYCEINEAESYIHVGSDHTRDQLPSMVGRYPLAAFDWVGPVLRAGEQVVVDDIETSPMIPEDKRPAVADIRVGAFIASPLVKDGDLIGAFNVAERQARAWTPAEVGLVRETAERTLDAIERARAQDALRVTEERMRQALIAAGMGSFVWYPWEDRTEPDPQLLALFGLPADSKLSLDRVITALIHPADRDRYRQALARAIDPRGVGEFTEELRLVHSDGTERWLMISATTAFGGHPPRALRMAGVAADITEQKRREEELREADHRKDEFLAMLAHELRNPLAPIRTGLELIHLRGNTPEAVEQVRSMMERQVRHMVRLVDDLLDVSRITSGKITLHKAPTSLASLVRNAVETNRHSLTAKDIELDVELPREPCELDVDATRFVQVLSNLLHNANKFTGQGGRVRITAEVVAEDDSDPEVLIRVSDTGIGMTPDLLPRIFEPFTQGDTDASEPGLGIGLALARQLIEMHGGRIDAHSAGPGHGSVISIRVPCTLTHDAIADAGLEPGRLAGRRVLVIDDNEDAANATAMFVEALGGSAEVAYDGESGLRAAQDHRPEVVLLDIGMPGQNGYETCRRIRSSLGRGVTLIALTGYGTLQDKANAESAGFDKHLTKPVDAATLSTVLS